jgi:Alcohol dehydrogenase, class IV
VIMIDFFEYHMRTRLMYKIGLARDFANEVVQLGVQRALLVADPGVVQAGLLDRVREGLEGSITVASAFTDVPPDSSVATVEQGAAVARDAGADVLIAVGGGSAIDTAKAMRILLTEGGTLYDYQAQTCLHAHSSP